MSWSLPLVVLVVDDNVDSATSLAKLLNLMGSRTVTAFNGLDALQTIMNDRPDLVFLDIGLPGMSGHEVAPSVRQNETLDACYLVALSGYGQQADIQTSAEAGFDHHLVKPVTLESLMGLLNRLPISRPSLKRDWVFLMGRVRVPEFRYNRLSAHLDLIIREFLAACPSAGCRPITVAGRGSAAVLVGRVAQQIEDFAL